MKKIITAAIFSAFSLTANAASGPSDGIMASVGLISISLMSTLESTNYYSQNAQDDAASYIASQGEIEGPALGQAIQEHRKLHPESNLTDLEIAQNMLISSIQ